MLSDFERIIGDIERKSDLGEKVLTKFLSLDEQNMALRLNKQYDVNLFGGFNNAERKRAIINERNAKISAYKIIAFEISYPPKLNISHRAILGTLMSLGIKRNNIGDIIVTDTNAYFFICSEIASVIEQEFTKINGTPIALKKVSYEKIEQLDKQNVQQVTLIVSSLRLDSLIASGFKMSRNNAKEQIEAGMAFINNKMTLKPDVEVEPNQIVSLRHYGRIKLCEIGKTTKKDRIVINVEIYQ